MPPSPPFPATDAYEGTATSSGPPHRPASYNHSQTTPNPAPGPGSLGGEVSDVVALTEAIRLLVAINKRQNAILELFLSSLPSTQPSDTLLESSTDDNVAGDSDTKLAAAVDNNNNQNQNNPHETTYIEQWIDKVNLCEQE